MKKQNITAFYLETLLLILVFVAVILVLSRVFGISKARSSEATLLTNAVCLAQNAAEAVSAADSPQALLVLLDEGGNASLAEGAAGETVFAEYDRDMTPHAGGELQLSATWEMVPSDGGSMVNSRITVWRGQEECPIYTLETAVFLQGVVR